VASIKTHAITSSSAYFNLVERTLIDAEGNVPTAYLDSTKNATVGIGYNLNVAGNLKDVLQSFGVNYADSRQTPYIVQISNIISHASSYGTNAALNAALNSVMLQLHNKVSASIQTDFAFHGSGAINLFPKIYADLHIDQGISAQLGASDLPMSLERVALASLEYNSPSLLVGNLATDIKNGNRAEAWYEIRYQSNGGNSAAIAERRDVESELFGLYDSGPVTAAEANQVFNMVLNHENLLFPARGTNRINPDSMVTAATRDYADLIAAAQSVQSGLHVETLADELAPAARYLLTNSIGSSGHVLVYNSATWHKSAIDVSSMGSANLAVFLQKDPANPFAGTTVKLNDGDDLLYSDASAFVLLGTGTDHLVLNGPQAAVAEFGKGAAPNDTIAFLGHDVGASFANATRGTDQYGRTYSLSGTALNITMAGTNSTLSIGGFHNGDFGIFFNSHTAHA
jgi:GH24 family phage-related lysozyme (muramidase)